jgi:hypothetical protein
VRIATCMTVGARPGSWASRHAVIHRGACVLSIAAQGLQAEGVGFEPTMELSPHSGFQDRRHRPLGEPSRSFQGRASAQVRAVPQPARPHASPAVSRCRSSDPANAPGSVASCSPASGTPGRSGWATDRSRRGHRRVARRTERRPLRRLLRLLRDKSRPRCNWQESCRSPFGASRPPSAGNREDRDRLDARARRRTDADPWHRPWASGRRRRRADPPATPCRHLRRGPQSSDRGQREAPNWTHGCWSRPDSRRPSARSIGSVPETRCGRDDALSPPSTSHSKRSPW